MNQAFSIPGHIRLLNDKADLPVVELCNQHGRALVCLQGAQVIDYQPKDHPPVLWLSEKSRFETGKAIRGGIPICWPWFGDHPQDPALPAHGFARTRRWTVLDSSDDGHATCLTLGLEDDATSRKLWPFAFKLELQIRLDLGLSLTLTTHNPNDKPIPLTEALHSYFAVSDIHRVSVTGLEGCRYRDKLDNLHTHVQAGALTIADETDRVYLDTDATVTLEDSGLGRRTLIRKEQSHSTVIWNPWREKALSMSDVDNEGHQTMLCVETANALDNALEIPPGQSHALSTRIESILYDKTGNVT